ncbi:MAG: protein kinase [Verrucomicrobiales bacterium]|nr:protein kinase [Verrucomicrobiales bacterium]
MFLGHGRYELKEFRGQGGQGRVWLAVDHSLTASNEGSDGSRSSVVALKFLSPEIREDPEAVHALKHEVRLGRDLRHDNIVGIYEWHEFPSEPAFVSMEFIEGESLSRRVAKKPGGYYSWLDLRPMAKQLCDALYHVHRNGQIHCDVKPGNLVVNSEGVLKLVDLGLARYANVARRSERRRDGGTLAYLSPQRRLGHEAVAEDDVYALGATMLELLTGETPPHVPLDAPIDRRSWPEVPRIAEVLGRKGPCDVPEEVQHAIAACMSYYPGSRPSIFELARRLGFRPPSEDGLSVPAEPRASSLPPKRGQRRWFAALLPILLGLCFWSAFRYWPRGNRPQGERVAAERVDSPPVILRSPESVEVQEGGHRLSVVLASNDLPMVVQWLRDGQPIRGATNRTLVLPASIGNSVGKYQVLVTNALGSRLSEEAVVTPVRPRLDRSWTNSLGLRFVPIAGTKVLFCSTEVSVADYRVFHKSSGRTDNPFALHVPETRENHPMHEVSWRASVEFCDWLTRRERADHRLAPNQSYRLPHGFEWMEAAKLVRKEIATTYRSTEETSKGSASNSWWPNTRPDPSTANLAGSEMHDLMRFGDTVVLKMFRDGFPTTAPVDELRAIAGLYHLIGNVREWTTDPGRKPNTKLRRGASWYSFGTDDLMIDTARELDGDLGDRETGFRLVIDFAGDQVL